MQTRGKYQLGALLGQGGMGAVYKSFHPLLNRPVAIKVMLGNVAADPQAHQRFLREAQVVSALSHPHIINIFDVDVQDGQPYIVMDFIAGGSLAARLRAGPLPLDEILRLAIPLAEALDYAHGQGVIHRDLKPANVLLRPDESPVLADFGLARPTQADSAAPITATGAVLGTLAYMAPEQFSGQSPDTRADIYAFGVMLFEMLIGRPPFDGDSAQIMYGHLQESPPALRTLNPALPDAIERLVLWMLAKDPSARPQSAAEVAAALRSIQSGTAVTGPTVVLANGFPPPASAQAVIGTTMVARGPWPAAGKSPARRQIWLVTAFFFALLVVGYVGLLESQAGTPVFVVQPTDPSARSLPTRAAIGGERDPTPVKSTVLPPAALELVAAPLLTSAKQVGPEAFSIGGVSYRKDADSVWFFGEVRNDGAEARESVQVRVILRDAAGNELISTSSAAEMNYLKPGEISTFSVLFSKDDAPPPFASYALEVRSRKADFQIGYTYRDLSIAAETKARRDTFGFIKISGRVRNDGTLPARFVQIHAAFYDQAGHVVGIGTAFAETAGDAPLAASADARFELQGIVFSATPARYRLFVQGSKAP